MKIHYNRRKASETTQKNNRFDLLVDFFDTEIAVHLNHGIGGQDEAMK